MILEVVWDFICEMVWYDDYLSVGWFDCSVNMILGNKKGGLLNIVEKVMGLISKFGFMLILGVVVFGERIM